MIDELIAVANGERGDSTVKFDATSNGDQKETVKLKTRKGKQQPWENALQCAIGEALGCFAYHDSNAGISGYTGYGMLPNYAAMVFKRLRKTKPTIDQVRQIRYRLLGKVLDKEHARDLRLECADFDLSAKNVDNKRSKEGSVSSKIQSGLKRLPDIKIMRNNTGFAWVGSGKPVFQNNNLSLFNPRGYHFGLGKGTADLIGWKSINVTPDMVGKKIAVFTAIEVKDKSKPEPAQIDFLNELNDAGGYAGVAHNLDEALEIIGND